MADLSQFRADPFLTSRIYGGEKVFLTPQETADTIRGGLDQFATAIVSPYASLQRFVAPYTPMTPGELRNPVAGSKEALAADDRQWADFQDSQSPAYQGGRSLGTAAAVVADPLNYVGAAVPVVKGAGRLAQFAVKNAATPEVRGIVRGALANQRGMAAIPSKDDIAELARVAKGEVDLPSAWAAKSTENGGAAVGNDKDILRLLFGDANTDSAGNIILNHGRSGPFVGGYFDLSKVGSQRATTEGWGSYWSTSEKNARKFGKHIERLPFSNRLLEQIVNFDKKISGQPSEFARRQLEKLNKAYTVNLDDLEGELYNWKKSHTNAFGRPYNGTEIIFDKSQNGIKDFKSWLMNEADQKWRDEILGIQDPIASELYKRIGSYGRNEKRASNMFLDQGLIGATFSPSRDLHAVDLSGRNVLIWDQPTLQGLGVETWLD